MEKNVNYDYHYLVSAYDIPANECWMEDMAREGWTPRKVNGSGKVGFERGAGQECRVRMCPTLKKEDRPEEEQLELYESMGWHYLGTVDRCIHVWRCDDPEAPELDTDPQVQALGYERLKKKAIRRSAFLLLMDVFLWFILASMLLWSERPILTTVRDGVPGQIVVVVLYTILAVATGASETGEICRAARSLRDGVSPKRPAHFWRRRLLRQAASVMVLICVLWANGTFMSRDGRDAYGEHHDRPCPEAVYPDLAVMEQFPDSGREFFGPKTKAMELAPRMWFIRQFTPWDKGKQSLLESDYYHMLTETLAVRLSEELCEEAEEHKANFHSMEEQSAENLDSFRWMQVEYRESPYPEQYAVARLGKNVLSLTYQGPGDLREQADYFAGLLSES